MDVRRCIYTGKEAKRTDKVIPKEGGDEVHNWANTAPCSESYKKKKGRRFPSELELKANRAFKMLELAKLDLQFHRRYGNLERAEEALIEIQVQSEERDRLISEIAKNPSKVAKSDTLGTEKSLKPTLTQKKKKNKEIKIAYKDKEITEMNLDKVLKKKKMEW